MANSSKYVTVKSQGHHEKTKNGEFKTEQRTETYPSKRESSNQARFGPAHFPPVT